MLWNEIGLLREVCERQRQSVSKLVQFLLTLVQPSSTGVGSHAQKHRFNGNSTPKTKRLVPYIESSNLLEDAQLDDNFHYSGLDVGLDSNTGENEMSVAAPQQLTSILASQSLQPLAPNWDILACLEKDISSQSIDSSSVFSPISPTSSSQNQFNQALGNNINYDFI